MPRRVGPTQALAVMTGAALALGSCARGEPGAAAAREEAPPTAESAGYASPPSVAAASRTTGRVVIEGRAQPGARVRLAAPDGSSVEAAAAGDGVWRAALPDGQPRMYALSAEARGRAVRAEGALITLPAPGPAALLARSGYAALPPPVRGVGVPAILAVDFDAVGSAAVGGTATPATRVELAVDGQAADADLTDAGGRFALVGPRTRPLGPGAHQFAVSSPQGTATVMVVLSPPAPLQGQAMRATRTASGWRIDWAVPGGGVQSTVALDRPPANGS